jgi:hypothetical protein
VPVIADDEDPHLSAHDDVTGMPDFALIEENRVGVVGALAGFFGQEAQFLVIQPRKEGH